MFAAAVVAGTVALVLVLGNRSSPKAVTVEVTTTAPRLVTTVAAKTAKPPGTGTSTPAPRGVGVPATYLGRFTAVDRLERCNATVDYVYCSAGPSGRAARLTAGVGAEDLGVRGSSDLGGPSMPEGTSFKTPNGQFECGSSTRGITCDDLVSGADFVIGDYKVIIHNP